MGQRQASIQVVITTSHHLEIFKGQTGTIKWSAKHLLPRLGRIGTEVTGSDELVLKCTRLLTPVEYRIENLIEAKKGIGFPNFEEGIFEFPNLDKGVGYPEAQLHFRHATSQVSPDVRVGLAPERNNIGIQTAEPLEEYDKCTHNRDVPHTDPSPIEPGNVAESMAQRESPVATHNEIVVSRTYYFAPPKLEVLKQHVEELRRKGIIKDSRSPYTSPAFLSLHNDMPSIILDVISVIDAETSCSEGNSEERTRFCFIVKETEKFLSDKLLKERLEIDTLQDVGTLKNKNFYTKFIKVKTKLYYKQRKFNLFREESEGYAKLIAELNQEISGNVTAKNVLEIIKSLIGCFNLDPNRVLDVILESFECRPDQHQFFIPLLRSYMSDPKILCEVLGFKYCFYQTSTEEVTPKSLYLVTALMLQHSIIALDDIYCWVSICNLTNALR
ncbi:unnamed protein product, partial [Timema podura]|nr:unnamed protein product [Timema podura]